LNKPFLIPWASKMCANRIDEILNRFKLRLMPRLFKKGVYEITPAQVFDIFMRLTRPQLLTRLTDYGKKQHRRIADTAADIGTRAHKAIDDMINGRPVTITEDIRLPVEGFLHWLKITNLIIVAGDTKVASAEEKFGGSLDGMVIDQNNALQVLDFKTSNQFADSYAFQMGAYSKAFTETYGLPTLPEGFILRLDKFKPKIEIRKVTFINEAWKTFQSLLWVYQLMKINYYDKTQTWKFTASKSTRDEYPKEKPTP